MPEADRPTNELDQVVHVSSDIMILYVLGIIGAILLLCVWYTRAYYSIMNVLQEIYSAMYSLQGKLQSYVCPGMWIPFIRTFHSRREKWIMSDPSSFENKEAVLDGIMNLISQDRSGQIWTVDKIETSSQPGKEIFVRIFVYTWAKWLDIIEMSFKGEEVKVLSFSSGCLPLCIPFACIFNLFLFLVPFSDMGLHKKRLRSIVQILGNEVVCVEKE